MYHNPQAVVQVNGKHVEAFVIKRSVRQGFLLSLFLYDLTLEPLLHKLRNEGANLATCRVLFVGSTRAYISLCVDITVFESLHLDIKATKKAVMRYEKVAGANINLDTNKALWLGAWRGGTSLPGTFCWSDRPIHILGVWFRPDHQQGQKWLELKAKVKVKISIWLQKHLFFI